MENNVVDLKVGRYVIRPMPVVFILLMALMCSGVERVVSRSQNAVITMQQENSTLSRRLTASDLKVREVEQKLASNSAAASNPGVVIISPGDSKIQSYEPPKTLSSYQYRDTIF